MADDIFLSQEEQDERAKKWLKDNGPALAIGIALGLGAIFGFNQYKANKLAKAELASGLYVAALNEINDSDNSDINAQVAELKDSYASSSYAAKAALLKSKQLSVNDMPAAIEELQWVIDNAPEVGLRHTARIRQAKVQLAMGDYEAATNSATQTDASGFESHYTEILGDVNAKQGDFDAAREHYQAAIDSLSNAGASYAQVLSLKMDRLPGAAEAKSAEAVGASQAVAEPAAIESAAIEKTVEEMPTPTPASE